MSRQKNISASETTSLNLLTIPDVARILGVCPNTVYALINSEGLPSLTVGRARRVRPEALHAWLKKREQESN